VVHFKALTLLGMAYRDPRQALQMHSCVNYYKNNRYLKRERVGRCLLTFHNKDQQDKALEGTNVDVNV
jgi:hypothetical protein